MASSIISRRKPKDYRPILLALTRYYAREAAKDAIRARGRKVSQYSAREIAVMADQLLMDEPEPFVARAKEVIAEWIAEDQAKERRRLAHKSKVMSKEERPAVQGVQLHETHAQNGARP
jgi:hypothetical protein